MIDRGALEEVQSLLARGLDPNLPVMRAIGVPELSAVLNGDAQLSDAIGKGQQATRNYAKRQYTWLRHQPPQHWHRIELENFESKTTLDILCRIFGLT
jgi:tRNA dimethylallyltransferase